MDTDSSVPRRRVVGPAVRSPVRSVDVLAVLAVPLVLLGVFALPLATRQSLAFDYTDPTVVTAFVSPFVHLDGPHLFVNVLGYLLVVPVAYLLSVISGNRRRFLVVFATFLLVFPPILSYLNLAILRPAVGVGFSGVLLAFVGYLPLAIADYAEDQFDLGPASSLAPVLFFLGLALISVLSVQSVEIYRLRVFVGTAGLALAALLSAILYAIGAADEGIELRGNARAAVDRTGYFELAALAIVLFLTFPFVAFPADPVALGGVVNLYAHLLGYALGFTATYATVETGYRLPGSGTWV